MTQRHRPRRLDQCLNILDLRELARRKLPGPIFNYVDGGAETEITMRSNCTAFDEWRLMPKFLVNVTSVKTATRILGQDLAWPVLCSPTGASRFYHPEGELAVARGAAATGTLYSASVAGSHSFQDIAKAGGRGPRLFQVLPFKDRSLMAELMETARQAGYTALCLTIDAQVRGKRERELRTGLGIPMKLSVKTVAHFAGRPSWFFGQARRGPLLLSNVAKRAGGRNIVAHGKYLGDQIDPAFEWNDVKALVAEWGGPFAIKGLLSADDARRAVDTGASAVIVSNHGGRQLDATVAAIEALPEIAQAVGHQVEVILDGGIRRGTDILKALALGAKACSLGRPYLFGLAAGGEAGVRHALNLLKSELVRAMQLSGCTDVTKIDPNVVRNF